MIYDVDSYRQAGEIGYKELVGDRESEHRIYGEITIQARPTRQNQAIERLRR